MTFSLPLSTFVFRHSTLGLLNFNYHAKGFARERRNLKLETSSFKTFDFMTFDLMTFSRLCDPSQARHDKHRVLTSDLYTATVHHDTTHL